MREWRERDAWIVLLKKKKIVFFVLICFGKITEEVKVLGFDWGGGNRKGGYALCKADLRGKAKYAKVQYNFAGVWRNGEEAGITIIFVVRGYLFVGFLKNVEIK